jgi:hypothetical protein
VTHPLWFWATAVLGAWLVAGLSQRWLTLGGQVVLFAFLLSVVGLSMTGCAPRHGPCVGTIQECGY